MIFLGNIEDMQALGFKLEDDLGTIKHYTYQYKGSKIDITFPYKEVFVWTLDMDAFLEDKILEKLFELKEANLIRKQFKYHKITDNRKVK